MKKVLVEIQDPRELIELIQLSNSKIEDVNPIEFISTVWSSVDEIWTNNQMPHFTYHGISHSCNIVCLFMDLDGLYEWSDHEKLVFTTAALIHDIGMQYNKWSSSTICANGWPRAPLSHVEVRRRHVELGYRLVEEQIYNVYSSDFPKRLCINEHNNNNLLWHASMVAAFHSGESHWGKFITETTWASRLRSGVRKNYRPRLLAGTLRICDEFDGDQRRIKEKNRIYGWDVDDTQKKHWMSCLFIKETIIEVEDSVVKIRLDWQVPENATENQKHLIKNLIDKMRILRINSEIKIIEDFYKKCGESRLIKVFDVLQLDEKPNGFIYNISSELEGILQVYVDETFQTKREFKAIDESELLIPENIVGTPAIRLATPEKKMTLIDELKQWYDENKECIHVELINKGEHTDTYLNCRTLVSKPNLVRKIANYIYNDYKDKSIDCILAVGTSSIPLSIYLSMRLKCAITFTTSGINADKVGKVDLKTEYVPTEVKPLLEKNQNILIIDDIVSGGSVAKEILDYLYEPINGHIPSTIYHFSIFKLGSRATKQDERIKDGFAYLLEIKEVMYAESKDLCPLCIEGNEPYLEKEMY